MNVLSEFDGISCGQVALQRAGIFVENYFASEIDKYAIRVTQTRHPKTVQLGTVTGWKSWDLPKIDLLIAGSPCQGFSNAGLGLNFDDPRSKLFFEFVETLKMLRDRNPDLIFLLENVRMKQEWQDIISEQVGVRPIKINSALVSAQNRVRLYWTNIQGITQPEDKHIYLKDIIECGEVDREKSYTIDANYFKGGNPRSNFEDGKRQLVFEHQSHKRAMVKVQGAAIRNQVTPRGVEEQLNIREDGKSNCVVPSYTAKLNGMVQVGVADGYVGHDIQRRVYSSDGKSPTILAIASGGAIPPKIALDDYHYRKLTVLECERLQTLSDGYTDCGISNTQRYKCVGNGWTVDVIAHILSFMKK